MPIFGQFTGDLCQQCFVLYTIFIYCPFLHIRSHGAVFGVWSANASVGNIMGAFLVSK